MKLAPYRAARARQCCYGCGDGLLGTPGSALQFATADTASAPRATRGCVRWNETRHCGLAELPQHLGSLRARSAPAAIRLPGPICIPSYFSFGAVASPGSSRLSAVAMCASSRSISSHSFGPGSPSSRPRRAHLRASSVAAVDIAPPNVWNLPTIWCAATSLPVLAAIVGTLIKQSADLDRAGRYRPLQEACRSCC